MGKHILVIDDESSLAHAIEMKLTAAGYHVTTASNGKQGLDSIQKHHPDLVLTDLIMPVMGGFEMLEQIQKDKLPLKVIVISNLGQEEDVERVKKLGALDFFVKADSTLAELVELVGKHLDQKPPSK